MALAPSGQHPEDDNDDNPSKDHDQDDLSLGLGEQMPNPPLVEVHVLPRELALLELVDRADGDGDRAAGGCEAPPDSAVNGRERLLDDDGGARSVPAPLRHVNIRE